MLVTQTTWFGARKKITTERHGTEEIMVNIPIWRCFVARSGVNVNGT